MGYTISDVQIMRKESNPSDELLTSWSHYNHTILELFAMLSQMQLYQPMTILKPFVDTKYHKLLHEGEGNLQQVFGCKQETKGSDFLKIGLQNFNKNQALPNKEKMFADDSKEKSEKIINQYNGMKQNLEMASVSNNLVVSIAASNIFSSSLPRIPYNNLVLSTDYWNKINLLGRGGFGTVFKGL